MKILIFATVYYPDIIGGGEFSTKLMTEGLASRGHNVEVHTLGLTNTQEKINGVTIYRHYIKYVTEEFMQRTKNRQFIGEGLSKKDKILNKYIDIYYSKKWYQFYKKIIQNSKPNVVHTVSPLSYMGRYNCWKAANDMMIPISHIARSPDLIEFAFWGGKLNRIYQFYNARASKFLTALAAPSDFMLRSHLKCGIKAEINETIYNAIDIQKVSINENLWNEKENSILYAGDIRKEKGILTLVKAVENSNLSMKLILVGKGILSDKMKEKKQIKVIDWVEQHRLYDLMKRAKLVVLPSEWNEAFGRVLIESISNGTIAIGSDCGGIPEVLNFDKRYIFKHRDINELREKLERVFLLDMKDYLLEINQQQDWLLRYSEEEYIDKWENFFLRQI